MLKDCEGGEYMPSPNQTDRSRGKMHLNDSVTSNNFSNYKSLILLMHVIICLIIIIPSHYWSERGVALCIGLHSTDHSGTPGSDVTLLNL